MKIKTIDINAKEWFDKINGNSYFSVELIVNYGLKSSKTYLIPSQYGYGSHYEDEAKEKLIEKKLIQLDDKVALWRYCQDNNIIMRSNKQRNCLKKDVIKHGFNCYDAK